MAGAFEELGWHKPVEQFQLFLQEAAAARRITWVAWKNSQFAGYVTLHWQPDYPHFARRNIPEIQDLNVLPRFRRQGIASALVEKAEDLAFESCREIGIGVGLHAGYNAAQRMYVQRGYIPDGHGVHYDNKPVGQYVSVMLDDDLVLYFTRIK